MAEAARRQEGAAALLAAHPAPAGEAGWAREAREAARARLLAMGVPAPRDEYWRFTDPAGLIRPSPQDAALLTPDEKPVFGDFDRLQLVFVDGVFSPELSDPPEMTGLVIQRLDEVLATDIHWARDLFGQLESRGQEPVARPFAALNTACAATGVVIRATGPTPKPVSLRYLHRSTSSDALIRHLVRVDPGASLTLMESGPAAARLNLCMEVEIGAGGRLDHVRAQGRDHERQAITHAFVRLGQGSVYKSFTLTMNGRLTRNEQLVELTGPGASAHVAGACVGDGDFHHDDTVLVIHDAPGCESRQVFKKVLRNGATGVFQGKILVRPDAQKTDGYQLSQGLMLDEDSQFLAKPELEIHADDVKCSHGSTVGGVDETALFYLTSRGIARNEAENLLILAFLDEPLAEIADERYAEDPRTRLQRWLARRR